MTDKVAAAMDWDPDTYERDARAALEEASTSEEVESVSVSFLGRRSPLKLALREVRDRETGMQLNAIREAVEAAVAEKLARVQSEELELTATHGLGVEAVPCRCSDVATTPPSRVPWSDSL